MARQSTDVVTAQYLKAKIRSKKKMMATPVFQFNKEDQPFKISHMVNDIMKFITEPPRDANYFDVIASKLTTFNSQWANAIKELKELVDPQSSKEAMHERFVICLQNEQRKQEVFINEVNTSKRSLPDIKDIATIEMEMVDLVQAYDQMMTSLAVRKSQVFAETNEDTVASIESEVERNLDWLDQLYECAFMQISQHLGPKVPLVVRSIKRNIEDIDKNMSNIRYKAEQELKAVQEDLYGRKKDLQMLNSDRDGHEEESATLGEKIIKLENRMQRLTEEKSSALIGLENKKDFLEKRLLSLTELDNMMIKVGVELETRMQKISDAEEQYESRKKKIVIDHTLSDEGKKKLLGELDDHWKIMRGEHENKVENLAKSQAQMRKSLISILCSPGVQREFFFDENGRHYIDEYGRKIYKLEGSETEYQTDERGKLVPVQDDEYKYYYDEYGRYYLNSIKQRIYKRNATASEYVLDTEGVFYKSKEVKDGIEYHFDEFGRYFIDSVTQKRIYKEDDAASEYELDSFGNLVRWDRSDAELKECADEKISTEESLYLKYELGAVLTKGLAQVVLYQPTDPIQYLAHWLLKYRQNYDEKQKRADEHEALLQERDRVAALMMEQRNAHDYNACEAKNEESFADDNLLDYQTPKDVLDLIREDTY